MLFPLRCPVGEACVAHAAPCPAGTATQPYDVLVRHADNWRPVSGIIDVTEARPEKTIELARRLHPGARRVVVVNGTAQFG